MGAFCLYCSFLFFRFYFWLLGLSARCIILVFLDRSSREAFSSSAYRFVFGVLVIGYFGIYFIYLFLFDFGNRGFFFWCVLLLLCALLVYVYFYYLWCSLFLAVLLFFLIISPLIIIVSWIFLVFVIASAPLLFLFTIIFLCVWRVLLRVRASRPL